MYNKPEDLQKKVDKYFEDLPYKKVKQGKDVIEIPVPTITGLALFLGFESRQSFYDYEKDERFSYIIKRARSFIERGYEEALHTGGGAGAIFALKNMGWTDRQNIEHEGQVNVNVNYLKPVEKH